MAFNPFETFSVRSKTGRSIMAVLGIVIMLTFVLSSGAVGSGHDIFDQLGGLFNSSKKGDAVATAYGDKVYGADLREVRRQRLAARAFLLSAREASFINWTTELADTAKGTQLSLPVREFAAAYAAARPTRNADPGKYQRAADFATLQKLLREAKPESEDRRALNAVAAILVHDRTAAPITPVLPEREFDPESDDGAINFLLLLKKADRFGVKYSSKAVLDLVARETGGRVTTEDKGSIEVGLRKGGQFGPFSGEWLLDAVGNEFRARVALAALQGQTDADYVRSQTGRMIQGLGADADVQTRASAFPGGVTPFEFFEFYKDQCSEHTFDAIEVPASAFLPKVTGEPTTKERVELFSKYKAELPDPARDRPGFKDPRKVKVEFVALDATAKRITDAQPKVAAANLFLALSAGPLTYGGGGMPALVQAVHPELAATLPYREALRERIEANGEKYTGADQFFFQPRDASVYRPAPIAALLAGFAGYPSPTAAVVPLTLAARYIEQDELKHRVPFFLQAWLMPFNPVPTNAFGFPAYALPHLPKPPSEALYTAAVRADQTKAERRRLFEKDVAQFEQKLRDITKDSNHFAALLGGKDKDTKEAREKAAKGRAEARKYIAEWVAERGLTARETTAPQGALELSRDPTLKPLHDLAFPEPDGTNSFVQMVFANLNLGPELARQFPDIPQMGPFQAEWFPRKPEGQDLDKPAHLFWLTDDRPPTQHPSLKAANDALVQESLSSWNGLMYGFNPARMTERVDKAWRLEKARGLAKAEADRLAEKVKELGKGAAANPGGVEKEMRDLVAGQNFRVIVLDGMAKLKFQHAATQAQMNYGPPTIDKTKVLYPSADFTDKLLEIRTQPPGAVTIVADAPRTNYYVACLVATTPKTVEEFRENVFTRANAFGPAQNPLYEQYALREEQGAFARTVVARLRTEAGVSLESVKKEDGEGE